MLVLPIAIRIPQEIFVNPAINALVNTECSCILTICFAESGNRFLHQKALQVYAGPCCQTGDYASIHVWLVNSITICLLDQAEILRSYDLKVQTTILLLEDLLAMATLPWCQIRVKFSRLFCSMFQFFNG